MMTAASFFISASLFAFKPHEETDSRATWDSSHYASRLNNDKLTVDIIKEWLQKSSLVSQKEKSNIRVTFSSAGPHSEISFDINTPSQDWVLKTWDPDFDGEKIKKIKALRTSHFLSTFIASKASFIQKFNTDPNFPLLAIDEWAGTYQNKKGKNFYIRFMQKVRGIPMTDYCVHSQYGGDKQIPLSDQYWLAARLGEVFGNAHRATTTEVFNNPQEWKTNFFLGDLNPAHIFIDTNYTSPRISFIDLKSIGMALIREPYYGYHISRNNRNKPQ